MKYLKVLLFVPLCWSATSQAQTIEEIFPYTVQSHEENGSISVGPGATITGKSEDGKVHFKEVSNTSQGSNKPSCYGNSPCVKVDNFKATASIAEFNVEGKTPLTIVNGEDRVLESGVYFVNGNLDLGQGTIKNKNEDDQVVIYVNGYLDVGGNSSGKGGQIGESDSPLLIFSKKSDVKGKYYGYLYSVDDITLQTKHGDFCGRVSSKDLTVWSGAEINSNGDCAYDFGWVDEEPEITLSAASDIGYVDGEGTNAARVIIESSSVKPTQDFKINYDGSETLFYKKMDGGKEKYTAIENNKNNTLPLNSELYIKYNLPAVLNLTLDPQIEGQAAQSVNLKFVPYMVEVQPHTDCPQVPSPFVYAINSGCPVLAKAGEDKSVSLDFVSYSVDGSNNKKGSVLSGYNFALPNENTVKVNGNLLSELGDKIHFNEVALVQVSIANHCASYAPDCGGKQTQGSSSIIGRTVPYSLQMTATAGDVSGNVVYASQLEMITFDPDKLPRFVVEGLDTKGNFLPSYSGEFAGGLRASGNSRVALATSLSDAELTLSYSEPESGKHWFELDPVSLTFIKGKPFSETDLDLPLQLTIEEHDKTQGVDSETTLANANDKLRFGYLVLEDAELPVNAEGYIRGKLYYFDTFKHPMPVTEDHFSFASHIADDTNIAATPTEPDDATDPELVIDNDGVGTDGISVAGYEQAAEFDVKLAVDDWLRPHDGHDLVQPTAQLKFTADPRKRGNDRVFNRREVSR